MNYTENFNCPDKRYLIIALFLLAFLHFEAGNAFSQPKPEYSSKNKKAIAAFEKAVKHYEGRNDKEALKELKKAVSLDENFIEPHDLMGIIYFDSREYENSVAEYRAVLRVNPGYHPNTYFSLSKAELKSAKYDSALAHLEKFLSYPGINKLLQAEAEKMLPGAKFAAEAVKNPVPFNPENLGVKVNSEKHEYFPTITADEQILIYTRRIPKGGSGSNDDEDFYITVKNANDFWSDAMPLGPPVNTEFREGAQCVSPDGMMLFYTSCNRPDGKGLCDLYYSRRIGNRWGPPQNMGFPVNSSKWESMASISSDGKTLYFASDRSGGKGKIDIWQTTQKEDGSWTTPVSLDINTEGNDEAPFIHPDNQTMYFTSDGYPGMGGADLFLSRKNAEGKFSDPVNLGYPINTVADENTIFVAASGETAYYVSDRKEGFGGLDLYSFTLHKDARPLKVIYVKGTVYDATTNKKLNAKFELIDLESKQVVVQSFSDPDNGSFLVCLPVNRNYALNVSKNGYLFYSENYSLKERSDFKPYMLDVPLQPIEVGSKVVLKNIFFETGKFDLKEESKAELNKLASFLISNPKIKIEVSGHTDNVGTRESNQLLSENRAKSVYAYLLLQGITAPRLSYKGYGDTQPICPANDSADCKAQNRRTEFKVIGK